MWCKSIFHRGRSVFLLLLLLAAVSYQSGAQSFYFDETSARFVDDAVFDSLILEKAIPIARSNGLTAEEFTSKYPAYRARFADLLLGMLQHRFMELRKLFEYNLPVPGSNADQQAKSKYIAEINKAIGRALENPAAFYPLFARDETDRILSFHSDIVVHPNGRLEVTELITIYNGDGGNASSNDDIRRGIVRDFPTKYLDSNGLWTITGFALKKIYRNDQEESYKTQMLGNGTRIMAGREDVFLEPGIYRYRLEYETRNQLIFHGDKDELFWNVNGNGWVFTADSISCKISFPDKAKLVEYNCYTGSYGATDKNCRVKQLSGNSILFTGTRRFEAYEGLTVAAAIEKGVLVPPSSTGKFLNLLRANYIIPVLLLFTGGLFAFYLRTWFRKGRDPEKGTIFAQFEPPAGLSPADTGYIIQQQYGTHLFAASLVDAAVHKELEIEVVKGKGWFAGTEYNFNRPGETKDKPVPKSAQSFGFDLNRIYGQSAAKGKYNSTLKTLNSELENHLKSRFLVRKGKSNSWHGLFTLNRGYTWPGFLLIAVAVILSFIFMITGFTMPLLIFSLVMVALLIVIQVIFFNIMRSYTEKGRDIADHIEGFKMYLAETEQPVYNQLAPPQKTLELFEKYLPYAIALGVENQWAEKFDSIIRNAMETGYQPAYFSTHGSFGTSFTMNAFSQGISSGLSGTISSASTPPSSSGGGSGGGGFSGGGGGGGGGGGW
ncbi:DUF2207 domain-containing protein [Flavihumibacter stibioxidans]|uniref:DUF2207 domain-containing protein n=1 Tax=Flavihumibacter stibioxidans TaxID=1834163 RepID=A0ABR7M421_9BACT|nr:DUF2207 domain-containing protein [Flavihumibacter stibioxidans]MBC6489722.1 hypothetical protein [Flavihumibacter stibioxidans]